MIEAEYYEQIDGFYNRNRGKGEYARLIPKEKLINEIAEYSEHIFNWSREEEEPCSINYLFGHKLYRVKLDNPIVLKDEFKKPLIYKMDDKILRMRIFLNEYNDFIDQNLITLPDYALNTNNIPLNLTYQSVTGYSKWYDIESTEPLLSHQNNKCFNYIKLDCWLYRVFNNGTFDEGGRYYGGEYQSLSEEEREKILINGKPTVELDYKALHPRMLYHIEGVDYPADPYQAVSSIKALRAPIKKLMQIMINADNHQEAYYAFEDYLAENPEVRKAIYECGLDVRELMRMIREKHPRIEKYFNSGIGVKLQYRDSKIAEQILKYFTKKEIVCLCVHDSFIVEKQYRDELFEVMMREYKREMGFKGLVE
jgi:hypothetical protein